MTRTELEERIPQIVERLLRFDPIRIILFGSHARGDANDHSDIDLLVVLPEMGEGRREIFDLQAALGDLPVSRDVFVTTNEEIARRGDLVGTILRPALREGRVLYERS